MTDLTLSLVVCLGFVCTYSLVNLNGKSLDLLYPGRTK